MPPVVVALHAHPDDEAIFTGGTLRMLADAGARVVLVFATSGDRGENPAGPDGVGPAELASRRRAESERAAEILGAARVADLGYADSGLAPPRPSGTDGPVPFALADVGEAAERLARILREEGATCLLTDDEGGVYGHPDHVRAHLVGQRAAAAAGTATRYEVTVDREHLHFVETHLVEQAGTSLLQGDLGTAASRIGRATVEIDLTLDVRPVLGAKRAAMAAHASQIPEGSSALSLVGDAFAGVYGWEWFVRHGPTAALDDLR